MNPNIEVPRALRHANLPARPAPGWHVPAWVITPTTTLLHEDKDHFCVVRSATGGGWDNISFELVLDGDLDICITEAKLIRAQYLQREV